jgi:hypothetical protein
MGSVVDDRVKPVERRQSIIFNPAEMSEKSFDENEQDFVEESRLSS